MRFFGDGGSKTMDNLLQTLVNTFPLVQQPQNMVGGPTSDHSGPKNTVLGQKGHFLAIFWVKNAVFFVLAARKHFITCSNTLRAMFFEGRTQIKPVPRNPWPGCAVRVCMLWLRSRLRPATPGCGVGCVCVFAWALRLYPATPGWGVLCGCVSLSSVSAAPHHSWLRCWDVC